VAAPNRRFKFQHLTCAAVNPPRFMLPPILCYVTDRNSLAAPAGPARHTALIERIAGAAAAGVDWIQVREKDLEARQLFDLASTATAAMRGSAAKLLVNDRLDVAWATGAAGVHLGENSLPIADVVQKKRRSGPENFLVGASCHSPDAAVRAAHEGANYVFFGPVFATPSKAAFGEPQGLARLAEVCWGVSIPVLAIGGITAENAAGCLEAGATGIAGIRLFQEAPDLGALLGKIRSM
jgi:thiamine-phosphate pyrophosphorylase